MLPTLTVVFCVLLRLLPHPPNFVPMGATGVFAGRTLPLRWALLLTLGVTALVDVLLAQATGDAAFRAVTPFVYAGFGLQVFLGRLLRARQGGALAAAALGALGFFVISNVGVFLTSGMYSLNVAGLLACFTMALPFFGRSLVADLLWTVALALGYRAVSKRVGRTGWAPASLERLPAI
ncbi:MAG: DUF6580 family putative transport protein [Myxococcaceae bacterium]